MNANVSMRCIPTQIISTKTHKIRVVTKYSTQVRGHYCLYHHAVHMHTNVHMNEVSNKRDEKLRKKGGDFAKSRKKKGKTRAKQMCQVKLMQQHVRMTWRTLESAVIALNNSIAAQKERKIWNESGCKFTTTHKTDVKKTLVIARMQRGLNTDRMQGKRHTTR